jgi:hypothetical protein
LGSNDVTVSDCKKKRKVSFELFLSPLFVVVSFELLFYLQTWHWHTIAAHCRQEQPLHSRWHAVQTALGALMWLMEIWQVTQFDMTCVLGFNFFSAIANNWRFSLCF